MISSQLFKHHWLKTFRAPGYYKNLVVNILVGFFALYMAVAFAMMGFFAHEILAEIAPNQLPMETFNGFFIYMVIGSLIFRYFLQPLNTINLQPYQALPIKRSTLVNYILLKPLLNPANYVVLLFVIPFSVATVAKTYGGAGGIKFIAIVIFLAAFNTLTAAYLKRKFGPTTWGTLAILLFAVLLAAAEFFKLFSIIGFSRNVLDYLLSNPIAWLFTVIFPVAAYLLNKLFFAKNYYAESFNKSLSKKREYSRQFTFLERFGKQGELMLLILKLVIRNKRTKSTLWVSILFLLYGLLFYTSDIYSDMDGFLFFCAMIVTGALMFMFGQWLISWNGAHFDAIMTKEIDARDYVKANYNLLIIANIVCFIITTPYFFFGREIAMLHIAAFLFNTGVNIFLLTFFATFNTKRLDLNQGNAMNFQGTTYKNFLIVVPIMLVPMLIFGIASAMGAHHIALWIFSILGVTGIIFTKQLITLCEKQLLRRKYALSEGFRKKE